MSEDCSLSVLGGVISPAEDESAEMVKQKLEQQYATIQLQPLISSKGSTPVSWAQALNTQQSNHVKTDFMGTAELQ